MKPVVLVSLDWRRPQDGRTGLGIASIAAALQAAGVPLKIVDAQVNSTSFSLEQVQRQLEEAICEVGQPCLVGFGVYVWNDDEVLQLINHIKRPGVGVVLGGPQISYMKCGALEAAYPQAVAVHPGRDDTLLAQSDPGLYFAAGEQLSRNRSDDEIQCPQLARHPFQFRRSGGCRGDARRSSRGRPGRGRPRTGAAAGRRSHA